MTGKKKCANFGGKCHRPPLKKNNNKRVVGTCIMELAEVILSCAHPCSCSCDIFSEVM